MILPKSGRVFYPRANPLFYISRADGFSFFCKKNVRTTYRSERFFLFRIVPADEKEFIPIGVKNVYSPAITSFPFVITGEIMSQIADKATSE